MVKRGFAFEKVFRKKLPDEGKKLPRSAVTFFGGKPTWTQPNAKRTRKLAWQPHFKKAQPLSKVVTPLMRTAIGAVLILLIYFLFGSNFFTLNHLTIQGNRLVDAATVEKTIFPKGFSKQNALLFNESKATRQIFSLAQVKNVTFRKKIFQHTLEIAIEEHETSLIWQTNGQRFLVNRAGVVYDIAPTESPLTVVEDLKNLPVSMKQQILTTDFIEFVNFVSANLSRKTGLNIRQIIVPETTFELEVVTSANWKIIFDTSKSADTQLNNLAKILKGGAKPKQYVDLRILDRVYYK